MPTLILPGQALAQTLPQITTKEEGQLALVNTLAKLPEGLSFHVPKILSENIKAFAYPLAYTMQMSARDARLAQKTYAVFIEQSNLSSNAVEVLLIIRPRWDAQNLKKTCDDCRIRIRTFTLAQNISMAADILTSLVIDPGMDEDEPSFQ